MLFSVKLLTKYVIRIYALGSVHEGVLKSKFPGALGEKIRKERLSRSKQAFLIDSDTGELFMYLSVLGFAHEKYGV